MLVEFLQIHLNRLKTSSAYKRLLNNFFLVQICIILLLVAINNLVGLVFLIIFGLYLQKKDKLISFFSLGVIFLVVLSYGFLELTVIETNKEVVEGKILEVKETKYYNKITVRNGLYKNIVYDYSFHNLKVGDRIIAEGIVLVTEENRIENGFNYQKYLKYQKITNTIKTNKIQVTSQSFSIAIIKTNFISYLEKNFTDESLVFLKAMLMGDDEGFNQELKQAIQDNGILHLFAVSGLHIALFVSLIYKALQLFEVKENKIEIIACTLLFLYMVVTNFTPSVTRASLMYYLALLSKKLSMGLSTLDIISIIFIALIIVNPYYMYNLGFVLSFTAAGMIILISPLLKSTKYLMQIFLISLFALIITFPIVININNKINILSPITNVLFIIIVSMIILPSSFIVLILPIFKELYKYIINIFTDLTIFISKHFFINIRFPNFTFYTTLIYYILLILLIKFYFQKKIKYVLIIISIGFLCIVSNATSFTYYGEIDFLDLYNGEAIIIRDPYNECLAVIDTGDGRNNEVSKFLKSKGIKRLDFLIITHNHLDHNGEAMIIINEIDVNKIVVSAYDNSVLANMSTIKVKANDTLNCGSINFQILHPDRNYSDTNDNSIVIYSKIGGLNFLFLGDVSKSDEEKIARMNLDVDVVKIAHHGSTTSTSESFIDIVRPRYAIIQSGRLEKFGFPHQQTINVLNDFNVITLRTDLNYSIKYRYTKKDGIFTTLK